MLDIPHHHGIHGHFAICIKSSKEILNGSLFCCNFIHFIRFLNIIEVVTGHTHHGTGVTYFAISETFL
jgi:hypothetical protein